MAKAENPPEVPPCPRGDVCDLPPYGMNGCLKLLPNQGSLVVVLVLDERPRTTTRTRTTNHSRRFATFVGYRSCDELDRIVCSGPTLRDTSVEAESWVYFGCRVVPGAWDRCQQRHLSTN